MSLAIATSILRSVAACCASFESNWSRSSLVTPSTMRGDSAPNSRSMSSIGDRGVLDRVVEQRGGDGDVVEAEVGEDHRHAERVGDVGLARAADLVGVGVAGDARRPARSARCRPGGAARGRRRAAARASASTWWRRHGQRPSAGRSGPRDAALDVVLISGTTVGGRRARALPSAARGHVAAADRGGDRAPARGDARGAAAPARRVRRPARRRRRLGAAGVGVRRGVGRRPRRSAVAASASAPARGRRRGRRGRGDASARASCARRRARAARGCAARAPSATRGSAWPRRSTSTHR